MSTSGRPLVGAQSGPWGELIERATRSLRPGIAYAVRPLLTTVCERPEDLTPGQMTTAGLAARRLLEYAWDTTPRDPWLVIHALQSVCRTFESDPVASGALLRRALIPEHLAEHGFEELPWLAREVKRLVRIAPDFVEEVYRTAFAHRESSEATTALLGSRILPLTSTRRQDYGMALYQLAEVFPDFLAHAPVPAVRALTAALEVYVATRHAISSREPVAEVFDFLGREARIETDFSSMWDAAGVYRDDEPVKMLNAFEHQLGRMAEASDGLARLRDVVEVVVGSNRLAVVWARVLKLGARFPRTLGQEILPLASAPAVLTGVDTRSAAGELIRAVFPDLPPGERERIERAVVDLPNRFEEDRRGDGERVRDRLLGSLAEDQLVTDEARALRAALRTADAASTDEPPVAFEFTGFPHTEEMALARQGVPIDAAANRRIRELEQPVKAFAEKHANSVPTLDEVTAVMPDLQALREGLSRAETRAIHPRQRDYAWGHLAEVCAHIVRVESLSCADTTGDFVRAVLLEASHEEQPLPGVGNAERFDELPSWSSPAARIEAAEGLALLARHADCASREVLEAIDRLAGDPVPAVRFQIARGLVFLRRTAPTPMWQLIRRFCLEEESRGVLQVLMGETLPRLAGEDPDRVVPLANTVFDRAGTGPGAERVREFCANLFSQLYVWRGHDPCREIIRRIVRDPVRHAAELGHMLGHLREALTHGAAEQPEPENEAIRRRALELVSWILVAGRDGLRAIEAAQGARPISEWPPEVLESWRALARLADHLGTELYFASGAYKEGRQPPLIDAQKVRFYREAGGMLDELADLGFPSLAHHLLETLEAFIGVDPRGVFLRLARVVRGGRRGGYHLESMGADLVVRLVERYLAEHRALFREHDDCRLALLEILDVFVQAGWPSARRLTYRLEEIFR